MTATSSRKHAVQQGLWHCAAGQRGEWIQCLPSPLGCGWCPTKERVLKIGPYAKLRDELDAYERVATAIDTGAPNMRLVPDENEMIAVLIQEFVGGAGKYFASLRERIRAAKGTAEVVEMIDRIYRGRMQRWHFVAGATYEVAQTSYAGCLKRYVARRDVHAAAANSGARDWIAFLKRISARCIGA